MRLSFCLSVLLAMLVSSCKENPATYSVGTGNGTIYGYVYLMDSTNGFEVSPRDFTGAEISIQNGAQYTLCDIDGQYSLQSVPKGSFDFVFSKEGFATHKDVGHQFNPLSGTETEYYQTVRLYQIRRLTPDIVLRPFESDSGADTPYTVAQFSSRILDSLLPPIPQNPFVKIYFGKTSSISPLDPNSFFYSTDFVQAYFLIATIPIYRDSLLHNGFASDDKIYCASFVGGLSALEYYIDKPSGKKIFTGLSPFHSEVRSFILP